MPDMKRAEAERLLEEYEAAYEALSYAQHSVAGTENVRRILDQHTQARAAVLDAMMRATPEGYALVPKATFLRLFAAACELVNQADDPPHKYPGTDIDMLDAPKWAFDNVGDMIDAIDSECDWIKDEWLDAAAPEAPK